MMNSWVAERHSQMILANQRETASRLDTGAIGGKAPDVTPDVEFLYRAIDHLSAGHKVSRGVSTNGKIQYTTTPGAQLKDGSFITVKGERISVGDPDWPATRTPVSVVREVMYPLEIPSGQTLLVIFNNYIITKDTDADYFLYRIRENELEEVTGVLPVKIKQLVVSYDGTQLGILYGVEPYSLSLFNSDMKATVYTTTPFVNDPMYLFSNVIRNQYMVCGIAESTLVQLTPIPYHVIRGVYNDKVLTSHTTEYTILIYTWNGTTWNSGELYDISGYITSDITSISYISIRNMFIQVRTANEKIILDWVNNKVVLSSTTSNTTFNSSFEYIYMKSGNDVVDAYHHGDVIDVTALKPYDRYQYPAYMISSTDDAVYIHENTALDIPKGTYITPNYWCGDGELYRIKITYEIDTGEDNIKYYTLV